MQLTAEEQFNSLTVLLKTTNVFCTRQEQRVRKIGFFFINYNRKLESALYRIFSVIKENWVV